ncbi:high affinity immunoglobulin epsilon receptor subunit beta-like [Dunckerocampus dactyliophorus]|uniref:high affinity immunoglobulin epsilon receptor subunit beta-like n=1 Tax=Dunckerocampus dactyliophorus TaxID=161453 RepID=UPI0024060973|nr:high affinity immunoglobulin epsilon receptor subunit beta-like [Dunckerocampus dactyliophorus]
MASSSVTTVGGLVIVTQVIPQDETSIPLQTPGSTAAQAPPPVSPTNMDEAPKTDLQGALPGLGAVQVAIGLLCVLFSLIATFSPYLMLHVAFCGGVSFVVSGCLAVAARRRAAVTPMWACLVSNGISVLLSLMGVAYLCLLLSGAHPSEGICGSLSKENWCVSRLWVLDMVLAGLDGLFLVLLVLQGCVSVAACVFAAIGIRQHRRYTALTIEERSDGNEAVPPQSP